MASEDRERPFSSKEALEFGWNTTRAHLKPLLVLGAVSLFLGLLNQALGGPPEETRAFRSLLALGVQAAQVAMTLVWIRVALRLADGQPLDWSNPLRLLDGFFTFLLVGVLYLLVVAAGLVLLIVPGVIWAAKFGCAPFVAADTRGDPMEALRESNRLTDGVKGQLLVFGLLLIAVNLVGAIALGIGLLVTMPTTYIAAARVFRTLQARSEARARHARRVPAVTPRPAHS